MEFSQSISFQLNNDLLSKIRSIKWGGSENYTWLRNSKNLQTTFNTLKKIGVKQFISDSDYNKNSLKIYPVPSVHIKGC